MKGLIMIYATKAVALKAAAELNLRYGFLRAFVRPTPHGWVVVKR